MTKCRAGFAAGFSQVIHLKLGTAKWKPLFRLTEVFTVDTDLVLGSMYSVSTHLQNFLAFTRALHALQSGSMCKVDHQALPYVEVSRSFKKENNINS